MDHGLPDAKRTRVGSWSDGHQPHQSHRDLPPIYPPPTFLRPTSQGPSHHLEERRHHETEFASPSQDPHRTHSAPGQLFNAFGGGRDPIVKRDHSAEPVPVQMQHPRPPSTGEIMENHVNPPPPEDPRRQNIPYDHPMNQPYRPAPVYPQPPQNPPYERTGYEPPPTPVGFRDQILSQVAYVGPSNQRKKAPRTSQACEACRAAKAKCDDPKPCTSCREKGIKCDWRPPEPKQTDRVQAEMNDTLRLIKDETRLLLQKLDNVEAKLTIKTRKLAKMQVALLRVCPAVRADLASDEDDETEVKEEDKLEQEFRRPSAVARQPSTPELHAYHPNLSFRAESPELQAMQEDEEEDGDGKLVIPSESTIPVGHTTGAAKLLLWPVIDNLVGEKLREDRIKNEYPFIQEKQHGLRLFGRGPGGSPAHVLDATSDDTYSDVSASPAVDTLVHGQIGGITPPPGVDVFRGPEQRRGGLGQEGQLELDEATVRRLVQSYLKHIHIMHPILDPGQLERLVKNFLRALPEPAAKTKVVVQPPLFVVPGQGELPGNKRKRSMAMETVVENGVPYLLKPGQPQRSISTAILFLVLALGKICEYKDKIPDVVPDYESTSSSPAFRNGYVSPIQASPVVSPHSSGFPSPQDGARSSGRRSSGDGMSMVSRIAPPLRNMDVVPGLAYACIATDILGNELGENSLHHVHANVLASLYFGQLARPVRSHGFISNASRSLQIILRLKLDRLKRYRTVPEDPAHLENVPAKDNPLIFAFWTCLQLESDIVAELDLPHSGILTLEPVMPYPNLGLAKETNTLTPVEATSYQAQLWMRSHLNEIHRKLYTAGMEESYKLPIANSADRFPIIEELAHIISERDMIPPTMRWSESDPPPNDILAARLRAKFHGAEVITYRPFLKMVLNRPSALSPDVPPEDISPKIMNYSRLCIRAMVDSTRAFHGMGEGRLIVTNVWGTAHAQWGNVIVLQAAFQDPLLRPYIDEKLLKMLVRKTLRFLKNVADRASALVTDIKILEYVALRTGILEVHELGSSFSSTRTGSVDMPFH